MWARRAASCAPRSGGAPRHRRRRCGTPSSTQRTPSARRPPRLPEDRDFERSPHGLAGILAEAGLAVTHAGTASWTWRVAPADLWAGLTSVGNFGVLWRAQSADVQARLEAAYDALGPPWRDGDDPHAELAFDVACVVAEARVPRS